jgi:hypothetical protein
MITFLNVLLYTTPMDPSRNDNTEDNTLYTAMIWTLIIGILIVIATLLLTKPAPENFTELYFNNHTALPKNINLNEKYNYEFTIHNLENREYQYDYTVITELYNFDLSCEKSDLWLEGNTTRKTETDDPALFIKEDIYAITFNYELVNSKYILLKLDNKYTVNITEKTLSFNNNKKIYQWNLNNNNTKHKITIHFDPTFTRMVLDKEEFYIFTDYDYTKGYPYLETEYAEISGFQIWRRNAKQNVNIRIADSLYTELPLVKELESGIVILYSRFLSTPLYDKIVNQPTIRSYTSNYYYSEAPVNLTDYILTASFRTNSKIETGFEKQLIITYADSKITINNQEYKNLATTTWSKIQIKVDDNVEIFLNDEKIVELNQTINAKPYIKAYSDIAIDDFSIKSNEKPVTIKYTLPEKQVVTYSGLYTISTITSIANQTGTEIDGNDERLSRLQDLYDREKITWKNYRITTTYINRNKVGNFTIRYGDLQNVTYSISISNKTAKILLNGKHTELPVTEYTINRVAIDVNADTITIYINDQQLIRQKITQKEGMLLFEYPGIVLSNAQIENKDTNTVKIYKRETNVECNPILINAYDYKGTNSLKQGQSLVFKAFFNITEPFDIAKVQVKLINGQEIHYWVRQK